MEKNIKEEFISTLSHEIRTPLTSIKGFSQTMLSSWDMIKASVSTPNFCIFLW